MKINIKEVNEERHSELEGEFAIIHNFFIHIVKTVTRTISVTQKRLNFKKVNHYDSADNDIAISVCKYTHTCTHGYCVFFHNRVVALVKNDC